MTNETAQPAPKTEHASIRAVRAFVYKHAPQHPEDVELFINDLMRLLRVVIREAAHEVTSYMLQGLRR